MIHIEHTNGEDNQSEQDLPAPEDILIEPLEHQQNPTSLASFLAEGLRAGSRDRVYECVSIIHALVDIIENDPHEPRLALNSGGEVFVVRAGDDLALTDLEMVETGVPTHELLRDHLDFLIDVFELFKGDGHLKEESVSWLAAHCLKHLADFGGRRRVQERLSIDISGIDAPVHSD